ncbi:MAG: aminopeptidase P family protein [Elusimicrobiota bacterium]|jgi:Xaa-Pro aminopeptidase|nr:aminopeptidase P family protein [Elusimicrobiota bacterium]
MNCKSDKLKNFQKYLKAQKTAAFVVTDLESVNFLSDFEFLYEGDASLLITPNKAFCFAKQMYLGDLARHTPYLTLIENNTIINIVGKLKDLKIKQAFFDPTKMDYINGNLLHSAGVKEKPAFLLNAREIKTPDEIKKISKACKISSAAYDIFRKKIKTGMTEIQAAKMLEDIMASLGGVGLAFDTIMAFGENGANPHHRNTNRKLKAEEPVLLDYGCKVGGYCSDITRTFWHGKKPTAEFTKVFNMVKTAHDLAIKAARIGISGGALDAVCRDYLEEQTGRTDLFIHSTGHGLGWFIHEMPRIAKGEKGKLQADMTFTIEPGLYYQGRLGIRYENSVHLTKNSLKILTKK